MAAKARLVANPEAVSSCLSSHHNRTWLQESNSCLDVAVNYLARDDGLSVNVLADEGS